MRASRQLTLALLIALFAAPSGYSCFMRSPQPVTVWLDHIHVDIHDQVAVKTYDCTFRNPNRRAVVGGECYMELEPGARVDNMTVEVNGKKTEAEILDVKRANLVFQDMVKNGGSPALLEYYGNQLIRTKVPRIAPMGTVKVKLRYTTVLKKRGNTIRMQMLNTNPKSQMQPLKAASVTVNITSKQPIKNIYSPTHELNLVETTKADISVQWKKENYLPQHPFILYYALGRDDVGASIIAHREATIETDPGQFMMLLSPTVGKGAGKVTEEQILPKDVVFCVDTSGSMLQGKKMQQATEALKYCLNALRPNDRFNIVDFSTEARAFTDELVPVSEKTKKQALAYVERMRARGGTAIEEALSNSLKMLGKSDRLKMILFTTDGLPTIGERNPEALLRKMAKQNTDDVRIFVFGEGLDVNAKLLDFLALQNRGDTDYVLPDEKIDEKIAAFFDRVGSPMMTDIEIEFDESIRVTDMYPKTIPDLFKGEQVVLYGQYIGSGSKEVRLSGYVNGKRKTVTYTLEFPSYSNDDSNAFVPRLWAGEKVDHLLNEIRKSGKEDPELVNEIVRLAKLYGIVTPYTAFLMTDDVANTPMRALATRADGLLKQAKNEGFADTAKKRADSVQRLWSQNSYRRKNKQSGNWSAAYGQAQEELSKAGKNINVMNQIRYVGSRAFYNSSNTWYEGGFDPARHKNVQKVKVGSEQYVKLIQASPRSAKYLQLGNAVLNIKGQWYCVELN